MVVASCPDGGSYEYIVSANDPANNPDVNSKTFSAFINFTGCRENDTEFDGEYTLSGSWSYTNTLLVTLGDDFSAFTVLNYGPGYSDLISKSTMTYFKLVYNISEGASPITYDIKATGVVTTHDFFSAEDYSLEFKDGYDQALAVSTDGSLSMTTNGDFSETWTAADAVSHKVVASFQSLKLDLTTTSGYEDVSLNGQSSIAFTPDACSSGTATFVTSLPIRTLTSTGLTTQGAVSVNKSLKMTYNDDGTITVNYVGVDKTYNNAFELGQECPIATLDDSTPASTGIRGTASAAGTNSTISLTWGNADVVNSPNDMELHLNYYAENTYSPASAPTASTLGTWYLDFNALVSANTHSTTDPARYTKYNCTNPAGVNLGSSHVDVDGDGICDIGMDLLYDQENFVYWPEHLVATKLPAGYYVISVDDYDSTDTTIPVSVSIQIGDTVFGPFTHTFGNSTLQRSCV